MNIDTILRLLKNSGFNVLGTDGVYIHLEDPSCILRSFETFAEYAWIAIIAITGLLLFGWAIGMIRGAQSPMMMNLRNLTLIFGILSAVRPIVNVVWGGDLFAKGCKEIRVSVYEVQKILDARNLSMKKKSDDLYEEFDVYDTGALADMTLMPNEIPYSAAPVYSSGNPVNMSSVSIGYDVAASSVAQAGNDVIYTDANGNKYKKTNGTRAWRNNNPGNIRYSKFARANGAIGEAGGFAVFPDENTGMAAIKKLLQSKNYNSLTVGGAINRYAPPVENNTAAYQKQLEKLTGLSINMSMSQLTDDQLQRVADAIRSIEGWKPGKEVRL